MMRDATSLVISAEKSVRYAMQCLDDTAQKLLFLVDKDGCLIRTVSDGDLRRLLLKGTSIDATLDLLPEQSPVVCLPEASYEEVHKMMKEYSVDHIAICDSSRRLLGYYKRDDISEKIYLSMPHLGDKEIEYVIEAFKTNWIAPLGPNVDGFEEELADYVGSKYAAAVSSGTAAIHLALSLLNVGQGDTVLCPSFTFVASCNPITYLGAKPIFIDSEKDTWNMCPEALESCLESLKNQGNLPKAIVLVHLYGQSAKLEEILAIANQYEIPIVEDAAESLGSTYNGQHTGTFGRFGIFSFNGNKIITTSGGGALVSDDERLIKKARYLSTQARMPVPHYEHTEIGYNYRMSNVLAGIGRGQLEVLEKRILSRREIYSFYKNELSDIRELQFIDDYPNTYSNRWLSTVLLNPDLTDRTPIDLINYLGQCNIEARRMWMPMHMQPLYKEAQYFSKGEDICRGLFNRGVCLPSASQMRDEQLERITSLIKEFFIH